MCLFPKEMLANGYRIIGSVIAHGAHKLPVTSLASPITNPKSHIDITIGTFNQPWADDAWTNPKINDVFAMVPNRSHVSPSESPSRLAFVFL